MRPKHHRFLSCILLATYAGIALLGDGLHSLLPDGDHHHHHGLYVVGHSCDESQHAHLIHAAINCGGPAYASLSATDCDSDSHICEICEFLFQAISQPAEVAAAIDWQPLIVVAHAHQQPIYSSTSLGPQAPRGPPLYLG